MVVGQKSSERWTMCHVTAGVTPGVRLYKVVAAQHPLCEGANCGSVQTPSMLTVRPLDALSRLYSAVKRGSTSGL